MSKVMSARGVRSGFLVAIATMFLSQGCSSSSKSSNSDGSSSGGAGGSSGGNAQIVAICNQACAKTGMCFADAGFPVDTVVSQCQTSCMSRAPSDGGTCTNQSAIVTAANACLAMTDCTAFLACVQSLPECGGAGGGQGGSTGAGQGGSTGGGQGGSTGAGQGGSTGGGQGGSTGGGQGGSTGAAGCSVCDKAGTCCTAYLGSLGQPTTSCAAYSTSTCNSVPASNQSSVIQACNSIISTGAGANIAACQ